MRCGSNMAWIYSLSAECGPDRALADAVAAHFEGLSFELVTGKTSQCTITVHLDKESNWWADVFPDNLTRSGGSSLTDAIEISEVGFRLYKHLKAAPSFRFALFGCEVEEFRLFSELAEHVVTYGDGLKVFDRDPAFNGLVLRYDVWADLGRPIAFFPFAENYCWHLYEGKEHSVVLDDEDHGRLLRRLRSELYPKRG